MNEIMGIINLSPSTDKLKELTEKRTIGSVPIGGRYRIIDFVLSNMVNSGISNIGICTQGKARSIYDHIGSGKYWDLDRKKDGLFIFHPEFSSIDVNQKKGDIEVFHSMIDYFKQSSQEYVLISKSYMICNVDYTSMLETHKKNGADITIMYKRMNNHVRRFIDCDTVVVDESSKVLCVGKNLGKKKYYNISMEMYMMKRELLIDLVEEAIHNGDVDTLKECIYNQVSKLKVNGHTFEGYLACINSLTNYYKTNMDLLDREIQSELFEKNGIIYTKVKDEPSSYYGNDSCTCNSLISSGCIIEGVVENSILSRGVVIKKGAIVRNSIIMQKVIINETSNLNNMILDKNVVISEKKVFSGDIDHPYIIGKNVRI